MIEEDTKSVVLVGVGGQGILLASEILAQAAMQAGYEVKTNEVHGMAQRGGSVMAQIRYGKEVHSPLVARKGRPDPGSPRDRWKPCAMRTIIAPDGLAAVSAESITPVTVSSGAASYPANVEEMLKKVFPRLVYIDAAKKAAELGDVRAANIVLLGAISRGLDLPLDAWHKAIEQCVREKFLDLNLKAFATRKELCMTADDKNGNFHNESMETASRKRTFRALQSRRLRAIVKHVYESNAVYRKLVR